ncbi:MAG: aggregation factor core [Pseudomonadota bacterium]
MPNTRLTSLTCAALLATGLATAAAADVAVRFIEGAPKDRFEIANTAGCSLQALQVEIDLADTAGKLIFDTTGSGAGVEVFQPFEVREGPLELMSGTVEDGDNKLVLSLPALKPGQKASFTIDVDDTLVQSDLGQIRVSGGEMSGARVAIRVADAAPVEAVFADDNRTSVPMGLCDA